jgi:glycosyltransferase involved in cell wall biosynthesis
MERFPEFDNEKISVAYNALPSHFNNKPSIYKPYLDYAYFIVPGSIHPRKNTLNILKAFKKFIEETKLDFKIVFVGRFMWEATQELKLLWKEFAIKKWLIHIEDAEDQDMVNWISFAQALLYISQFEGFGIPILEGFSCKVPVITSDNTSLKEVALDAALKVNPHNVDDIKNAMIKVLNDYDLRQELINKGQVRLQDFDWHKSMEIVYASILSAAASHQHLK